MDWLSAARPLIIGHRGASADAPENTLAAFALALDQGADGIELDVQFSADGQLVVFHDDRLDRLVGQAGAISSLTAAELQAFELPQAQMIPTLDDVFEMLGPRPLYNVEIKESGMRERGLEVAVADRIQAYHLENRVIVSSFNPLVVRRCRRYLTRSTPVAHIRYQKWRTIGRWLAAAEADHPHFSLVDEAYMAWAKEKKLRVHVWTVDEPDEARRLFDLGVNGIFTNKPGFLRQQLRQSQEL